MCGMPFLAFLLFVGLRVTSAFKTGAGNSACTSLLPGHPGTSTQVSTPPFSLSLGDVDKYDANQHIQVCITGEHWVGIMMQARANGPTNAVGSFINAPSGTRMMTCGGKDDTFTHSSDVKKNDSCVTWVAPSAVPHTSIHFLATVAKSDTVYWANLRSSALNTHMQDGDNSLASHEIYTYSMWLATLCVTVCAWLTMR